MNKVKRVKNDNFTIISNVFLKDKRLSIKGKGLLAVVMGLPENWDFTISGICAILKEGKTAIYNTITELKSLGYCKTTILRDEKTKQVTGMDYTFFEEPNYDINKQENQKTPNQDAEKLDLENLNIANPPQLSINVNEVRNELREEKNFPAPAQEKNSSLTSLEQKKKSCDKKRKEFEQEVRSFESEFGKPMIDKFINYWSEKNISGTKMKFELQKTWETHRRLLKWQGNNFDTPRRQKTDTSFKNDSVQEYTATID